MQIKTFTIPIIGGEKLEAEMNSFLRSKKILEFESHLVQQDQGAHWCFLIKYLEDFKESPRKREKIDYKSILDPESFQRFSQYRDIRKRLAREEAIPAYAVFTNEELAAMAKIEDLTATKLKTIPGIGQRKLEKYGKYFINQDETT